MSWCNYIYIYINLIHHFKILILKNYHFGGLYINACSRILFYFYHFRGLHVILVIINVLRGICVFGGLECILVILDILEGIFVILEVLLGIFFKVIFNGILIFFFKKISGVFQSFWRFKYCFGGFEGTMVFLKIFAIFFLSLCSFEFENGWKCFTC